MANYLHLITTTLVLLRRLSFTRSVLALVLKLVTVHVLASALLPNETVTGSRVNVLWVGDGLTALGLVNLRVLVAGLIVVSLGGTVSACTGGTGGRTSTDARRAETVRASVAASRVETRLGAVRARGAETRLGVTVRVRVGGTTGTKCARTETSSSSTGSEARVAARFGAEARLGVEARAGITVGVRVSGSTGTKSSCTKTGGTSTSSETGATVRIGVA